MLLGWSVSGLLHGGMLAMFAAFSLQITSPRVPPLKEPFRWEVSLMAAPRTDAIVADGIPSPSHEAAVITAMDVTASAESQPWAQDADQSRDPREGGTQVSPMAAVIPRHAGNQPPSTSVAESLKSAPAPPTTDVMPDAQSGESALPPPEVQARHDAKMLQVETELESPTVVQRPQSVTRPVITRTALPDYTWVMDVLRTRLEAVKVYPSSARANHAEGRVVVQVSILGDGRIMNPEIEESSGHSVLDQAAVAALRAASPLKLTHLLEGAPVIMLVPLNYQLE